MTELARQSPVRRSFTRSIDAQRMLHRLVPGGAHTYARGSDQYPEDMAPVHCTGLRRSGGGSGRQLVRRVRDGSSVGHPRTCLRAGGRGRHGGGTRRCELLPSNDWNCAPPSSSWSRCLAPTW